MENNKLTTSSEGEQPPPNAEAENAEAENAEAENAEAETTDAGRVERDSPATIPIVQTPPPTFRDRAGYELTWAALIGLFVAIVIFFLVIVFDAPSSGDAPAAKKFLMDCLKPDSDVNQCTDERIALAKAILDDPALTSHRQYWKDMFQQIIGTTLLPILTALLGYLFGSGVTATRSNDNSVK